MTARSSLQHAGVKRGQPTEHEASDVPISSRWGSIRSEPIATASRGRRSDDLPNLRTAELLSEALQRSESDAFGKGPDDASESADTRSVETVSGVAGRRDRFG